ncbi:MAG TPA: CPBP family intramembrane metalloprotease [Oscillatoriales cyanobacterium M59_W2019_021]|nr:CPBP family intramembrane metalloprotease [Oscillatoriales cyanobacterium M4454_W2019_049]HIK51559.1 CPBP family intramembrane metalloprotease [Oscillatoriales cyanobacterium M59_W2019_021]
MNFFKSRFKQLDRHPLAIRFSLFTIALLLLWVPFALPIYRFVPDPNWVSILSMGILYLEFLVLLKIWGRYVYRQSLFQRYGLIFFQKNGRDWLFGLSLGLVSLFSLLSLEFVLGWLAWQPPASNFPRIAVEGFAVAVGIGFAEELLFRGWLLDELQRDYRSDTATWVNALLFAAVHFIKPWQEMLRSLPAFPGLFLLGLALVWAKKTGQRRLGLPMGLHSGLVWGYYLMNVGQLMEYRDAVPVWVTGIDANPLAGMMGMVWLSAIALGMKYMAKKTQKSLAE